MRWGARAPANPIVIAFRPLSPGSERHTHRSADGAPRRQPEQPLRPLTAVGEPVQNSVVVSGSWSIGAGQRVAVEIVHERELLNGPATQLFGSLIIKAHQSGIPAILIATRVGMSCERPVSIPYGRSQLMRIGRHYDFAESNSSIIARDSRPEWIGLMHQAELFVGATTDRRSIQRCCMPCPST